MTNFFYLEKKEKKKKKKKKRMQQMPITFSCCLVLSNYLTLTFVSFSSTKENMYVQTNRSPTPALRLLLHMLYFVCILLFFLLLLFHSPCVRHQRSKSRVSFFPSLLSAGSFFLSFFLALSCIFQLTPIALSSF